MDKRAKFVITSVLLSAGFTGLSFVGDETRFVAIAVLTAATVGLFIWSFEGLTKSATLLVLVLPALFTLGVGVFWFLLPANLLTRFPIILLYAIGLYALGLIGNIFIVSTVRTIALLRAAKGVGFVLTLLTSFLLFDAAVSLKASIGMNILLVFTITFLLSIQALWTSRVSRELERVVLLYSLVFSYALPAVAALLFFWPVSVVVGSLFLTVGMYVLLGLGQARIEGRLFANTSREYIIVGLMVFLAMILATAWR